MGLWAISGCGHLVARIVAYSVHIYYAGRVGEHNSETVVSVLRCQWNVFIRFVKAMSNTTVHDKSVHDKRRFDIKRPKIRTIVLLKREKIYPVKENILLFCNNVSAKDLFWIVFTYLECD